MEIKNPHPCRHQQEGKAGQDYELFSSAAVVVRHERKIMDCRVVSILVKSCLLRRIIQIFAQFLDTTKYVRYRGRAP